MMGEFFHGVEMHTDGAQIDLSGLSVPDISFVTLLLPPGGFRNGSGEEVDVDRVLIEFERELNAAVEAIRAGITLPDLFVPDLWQIGKGRAQSVPKEEGEYLNKVQLFAVRLGQQFYPERRYMESRHGYPGSLFVTEERNKQLNEEARG